MDYHQAYHATFALADHVGPVYLRLSRENAKVITTEKTPFKVGQAQTLRFGNNVTIVSTGLMVAESLKAAEEIDAEVINIHTIKPLDIKTILQSLKKTKKLIVAEEHQLAGGLGSAVTEALAEIYPVPTRFVAVRDQFGQSGTTDELFSHYGLTWEHIIKQYHSM
jgi:transketolase